MTNEQIEAMGRAAYLAFGGSLGRPAEPHYWDKLNADQKHTWHKVAIGVIEAYEAARGEQPKPRRMEEGWHYDSQGYCDNPGRGY